MFISTYILKRKKHEKRNIFKVINYLCFNNKNSITFYCIYAYIELIKTYGK